MATENTLSFIFTEESFRVDKPDEDAGVFDELKNEFLRNRYRALFRLGFKAKERNESPSLSFLHNKIIFVENNSVFSSNLLLIQIIISETKSPDLMLFLYNK